MSLPIKKTVFNLITTVLILGGYVYYMFGIRGDVNLPLLEDLRFWGRFMLIMIGVTIVAKILLMILFAIYRAIRYGDEENIDFVGERDKLIEMKSDRNGNYVFMIGLILSFVTLAMGYPVHYFFITLFSFGFLSGIFGDLLKIYYYTRGV